MLKGKAYFFVILLAIMVLVLQFLYENSNAKSRFASEARFVAVCSTAEDIHSPVSYLFGRSPFFIISDRLKRTYRAVANPYLNTQNTAGLQAANMLVNKYHIEAVIGNGIGFEAERVFDTHNIDIYTGLKKTVWECLEAFPFGLIEITDTRASDLAGAGGATAPELLSFFVPAAAHHVVQGQFLMCPNCNYHYDMKGASARNLQAFCPKCGSSMRHVSCVCVPPKYEGLSPRVGVL